MSVWRQPEKNQQKPFIVIPFRAKAGKKDSHYGGHKKELRLLALWSAYCV